MHHELNRNLLLSSRQRPYTDSQGGLFEGLVPRDAALQSRDLAAILDAVAAQLRAGAGGDRPINVRIRINDMRVDVGSDRPMFCERPRPGARSGADWAPYGDDEIVQ